MKSVRILYLNEQSENKAPHIHIYGVRIVDDFINVRVYSDRKVLDMHLNDRLCIRQKNSGEFDFYEPLATAGKARIKISCADEPSITQEISVDI